MFLQMPTIISDRPCADDRERDWKEIWKFRAAFVISDRLSCDFLAARQSAKERYR